MSTYDTPDRKSIAREHASGPLDFVGRDATGADHYWSFRDRAVIVVENGEIELFELAETPLSDLGDWRTHVETKRGWADCRVIDSPFSMLV